MKGCPGKDHHYVELLQGRVEMHTLDGRESPCWMGLSEEDAAFVLRQWKANPRVYPDGHAPACYPKWPEQAPRSEAQQKADRANGERLRVGQSQRRRKAA